MKSTYNILVTGCGGDIGQSIGKVLKSDSLFNSVVGCDMSDEHAGKFIFDKLVKIPACNEEDYIPSLQQIIIKESIDIILPISEPELRLIAAKKICSSFLNKVLICANLESMEIGFDKYATAEFLKESGLPFPETDIISEVSKPELPLILKDRRGSGSKSVFILKTMEDFNFYKRKYPEFIVQEFLNNDNEEYTCGLFRSLSGETRTIIYRRKLTGEFSGFGIVTENKEINDLLLRIAEKLNLRGSINVQLRLAEKGPCVFEINPRFSSTVKFRHMMGFEDIIWSVQDALDMSISAYHKPSTGTKFYKGFTEYVN